MVSSAADGNRGGIITSVTSSDQVLACSSKRHCVGVFFEGQGAYSRRRLAKGSVSGLVEAQVKFGAGLLSFKIDVATPLCSTVVCFEVSQSD